MIMNLVLFKLYEYIDVYVKISKNIHINNFIVMQTVILTMFLFVVKYMIVFSISAI
jgi:hypothetical protein